MVGKPSPAFASLTYLVYSIIQTQAKLLYIMYKLMIMVIGLDLCEQCTMYVKTYVWATNNPSHRSQKIEKLYPVAPKSANSLFLQISGRNLAV